MIGNGEIKEIDVLKILRSPPIYLSPYRVSRPDAFFSFKFETISSMHQMYIWISLSMCTRTRYLQYLPPPCSFSISFFDYPTLVSPILVFFLLLPSPTDQAHVSLYRMFREDVVLEMECNFSLLETRYYIINSREIR